MLFTEFYATTIEQETVFWVVLKMISLDVPTRPKTIPLILLPKWQTPLIIDGPDSVCIQINVSAIDFSGKNRSLYTGIANIKLIDGTIEEVQISETLNTSKQAIDIDKIHSTLAVKYTNETEIGPVTINDCNLGGLENQTSSDEENILEFPCTETSESYGEYSSESYGEIGNRWGDDVFLSQISDEILSEETIGLDSSLTEIEMFLDTPPQNHLETTTSTSDTDTSALKQLLSPNIEKPTKQRKTISFLGMDANRGVTLQTISLTDPKLSCLGPLESPQKENELLAPKNKPNMKNYQCGTCHQIFRDLATFKDHTITTHNNKQHTYKKPHNDCATFFCTDCNKKMNSADRLRDHIKGHNDPERQCPTCRKVYATKSSLRSHLKIHERKHACNECTKTFNTLRDLKAHIKKHALTIRMCSRCEFSATDQEVFNLHICESSPDVNEDNEALNEPDIIQPNSDGNDNFLTADGNDDLTTADSNNNITNVPGKDMPIVDGYDVLFTDDKVQNEDIIENETQTDTDFLESNESLGDITIDLFAGYERKSGLKRLGKCKIKTCIICSKYFDRISDLKRHLIEHVVKNTLAKNPVSKSGQLRFPCEICKTQIFHRIDKYKAHLREHAKLTLYKCEFCDKSFSDSSNFSKHKKVHGVARLQCDICNRKFNSKKMIANHMEYHSKNAPIYCDYCDKVFYFESQLKKHIKFVHKRVCSVYLCRVCNVKFSTLKCKWNHEWREHSIRKSVYDCRVCGESFRLFADLKKHCITYHGYRLKRNEFM